MSLVRALAGMTEHAAEMRDTMAAERIDRRRAEEAARDEHERAMAQALAAQDAAFWEQHPMARRIQKGKERVVAAEGGNGRRPGSDVRVPPPSGQRAGLSGGGAACLGRRARYPA